MPGGKLERGFLGSRQAQTLTIVLILQAVFIYAGTRREAVPNPRPLSAFPAQLGDWRLAMEGVTDKEVNEVLRADDILNRMYARGGTVASLFVAYFKTQRTGQAPHSPKNCLPGSGWTPSSAGVVEISIPGLSEPIRINQYIVAKGPNKSVVFYWYQTRNRVIASEYEAKLYLVLDSIRYNRSDTALVRVVVPVTDGNDAAATEAGVGFVRSFFAPLRDYLPS
jgi:EpsI family protein